VARPASGGIPSPRQGTGSGRTPSPAALGNLAAPTPSPVPSRLAPSGRTPSPVATTMAAAAATGTPVPAAGTPAPSSGSRSAPLLLPPLGSGDDPRAAKLLRNKKSRVGFGFILGALCMLAAVFGIRWLAAWAGREGVVIPHVIDRRGDAGSAADGVTATAGATAGMGSTPPVDEARPPSRAPGEPTAAPPVAAPVPAPAPGVAPGAGGNAGAAAAGGVAASGPVPAGAMGADGAAPVAARGERDAAAVAAPGPAPSGAGATVGGKELAPAGVDDEEEDEETLLGRVIPDAGTVIGEDEADPSPAAPPPPPPSRTGARSAGAAAPGPAPPSSPSPARRPVPPATARAPAQPVLVRITSSPLGAVVRTKKQVLGRTPVAIHFNPGNTYRLTFVKKGYVTSNRLVAVATGKSQSISVPMKKAAAPARRISIFRGR